MPPIHGIDPRTENELSRRPALDEPFAALAFKVMSDPYVGKLTYIRVYSGQMKQGDRRAEHDDRQDRAHRPHPPDAREPPRGARRDRRRRDRRRRRSEGDDHRRHARRRHRADPARVDDVPRPGDLGRDRAEDEGRPGQAGLGPAAPVGGGSDLPRAHRRGDRADADLRDGRAPPRDHRRPPDARVQRRRQRRPPAGRLPRDGRAGWSQKIEGKFVRQTGGRGQYGHAVIDLEPAEPGEGYEFIDKIVGGKIPQASTSRPSTSASRRRWSRASSPATRSSTSASRSSTARTTTSTRARWRSRSPARWRSRTRCSGRSPSCSSRSWPSRSSRPTSTSAT